MYCKPLLSGRASLAMIASMVGMLAAPIAWAADADSGIPHLAKHGTATQLIVDGKPFLCLGGELHNSSASSLEYMKPIWPRLARMNLNTVIASVSWELIEPTEGQFDFSLVDGLITDARANHVHLVFLWFGSWKNGLSSYQPIWVKTDPTRFPLAEKANGESMDILSTLGEQTCAADAKAFGALMSHIRDFDGSAHTVVAMQVENEVGMREDSRDRSPPANQAFAGPVPKELMDFLSAHKDTLMPELRDQWDHAGSKTSGTWEEVFGAGIGTDEIFMAWNYARYVGKVAWAGKAQYPLPMYANCWLDQPGTPKPGDYPSGGPLAHLMDVWHAGAPALDFVSPDLYVRDFAQRCADFTRGGNPLFIPETNSGGSGALNALYAVGKHDAICFSPFGIDGFNLTSAPDDTTMGPDASPFAQCYGALSAMAPVILQHQGDGSMTAFLIGPGALDESITQQVLTLGDYKFTIKPAAAWRGGPSVSPTTARSAVNGTSGLLISIAPDEFYVLSTGINLSFAATSKPGHAALASIDEGTFVDGQWVRGRRINGDESDHNRAIDRVLRSPFRIFRMKLYQRPATSNAVDSK
jgi:Domain of unknown function (DUF5597)/Beta-galactosidase